MKKISLSLLVLLVTALGTEAKNWKIGPSSVTGMDFASINAAMSSSSVAADDTLYLDQYYNESAAQTVTKRVVIIGTGYDTSLTDEGVVARLTSTLNLKANDVQVKSVCLSTVSFYNDDCIIDRCYTGSISVQSSTAGMNHIYSSYISGTINGYSYSNYSQFDIQNCVIIPTTYHNGNNYGILEYMSSSIINNNTICIKANITDYCLRDVTNTRITNNIILSTYSSSYYKYDIYNTGSGYGNTIEHNILSSTTALTYYPTNKIGYGGSSSELFTQTGNYSDYYKLADKSAAKGYATDGGEVGCHGGMFGCPSGGRPQYIPYFTKVTVGSRTENGKLPVSVSVKIQDE